MPLAGRRRGGFEELAYLAEHPDPDVRATLARVLRVYRGPKARALRQRIFDALPDD